MDRPQPNWDFRFMAFGFKIRDLSKPRMSVLKEVGIRPGDRVLDYGCGPGGYIPPLAKLVGKSGKIYALDIHPLAVKMVKDLASKKKLANVEAIFSDCDTGLPDGSVDVALLYDTYHDLGQPEAVLSELHRVLRPEGILSISDHHLKKDEIVSEITGGGLFRPAGMGKITHSFERVG